METVCSILPFWPFQVAQLLTFSPFRPSQRVGRDLVCSDPNLSKLKDKYRNNGLRKRHLLLNDK
jgi:hypothetical protein